MEQVDFADFKTECLRLLERVHNTREPLQILADGKPLAVVYPPPQETFGALRSTLTGPVGDLVEPVATDDWEALR